MKDSGGNGRFAMVNALWLLVPVLIGFVTLFTTWTCQRISNVEVKIDKALVGSDTAVSNKEILSIMRTQLDRIEEGNKDLLQRVARLEAKISK